MTLTQTLVRFATRLRSTDLPPDVTHKLRLHLLDSIGCGWAGSHTGLGSQARAAAAILGSGPCGVLGSYSRHAPPAAALANSLMINALDFDDGVEIQGKGMGHPGASLLPAALAALDSSPMPVSGVDVLSALAAGFEINNRLIHALQPSAECFAQVYGIAQHQAIGAAIVFGRIHHFDEALLHHAVGLAATLSCVPSLHKYNWDARPLVTLKDGVASAAQAGVQAACLARLGFQGSRNVLDGPQGYWRMLGSDRFDPDALTVGLGEQWHIRFGSFKRYPACRWLACALECMDRIMCESGWLAEDVAKVEVHTFARLVRDFMDMAPATSTDAQFSLPYTMAAVMLRLPPGAGWYAEEVRFSPKHAALMARVQATLDPGFDQRMQGSERQPGARVVALHRDGRRLCQELAMPAGSAERPISEEEIIAKACRNLASSLEAPVAHIEALLDESSWREPQISAAFLLGQRLSAGA